MGSVADSESRFISMLILACFFPTIAVAVEFGCGKEVCMNLLWGIIPFGGFVHAVYLLGKAREERYTRNGPDAEARLSGYGQPAPGAPRPAANAPTTGYTGASEKRPTTQVTASAASSESPLGTAAPSGISQTESNAVGSNALRVEPSVNNVPTTAASPPSYSDVKKAPALQSSTV